MWKLFKISGFSTFFLDFCLHFWFFKVCQIPDFFLNFSNSRFFQDHRFYGKPVISNTRINIKPCMRSCCESFLGWLKGKWVFCPCPWLWWWPWMGRSNTEEGEFQSDNFTSSCFNSVEIFYMLFYCIQFIMF